MKILKHFSLLCGIVLTLAAFPVFGQTNTDSVINKRPFQDFGRKVLEMVESKDVTLTENFLVEVEGELNSDGKFETAKTKIVRSEGNEKMTDIAKNLIASINDSGMFLYLSRLGISKINLTFAQNDEQMSMLLNSDTKSETDAKRIKSGFYSVLTVGNIAAKDPDEKTIFKATSVSSNGKTVIMRTALDKSVGQEIMQRQINKAIEQKKSKQK